MWTTPFHNVNSTRCQHLQAEFRRCKNFGIGLHSMLRRLHAVILVDSFCVSHRGKLKQDGLSTNVTEACWWHQGRFALDSPELTYRLIVVDHAQESVPDVVRPCRLFRPLHFASAVPSWRLGLMTYLHRSIDSDC